ncbi:MAG: ABC transporter ATP-binding protein [Burkholderiaceae bacterium]
MRSARPARWHRATAPRHRVASPSAAGGSSDTPAGRCGAGMANAGGDRRGRRGRHAKDAQVPADCAGQRTRDRGRAMRADPCVAEGLGCARMIAGCPPRPDVPESSMNEAVAPYGGERRRDAPATAPPVLDVVGLHKRFGPDREVIADLSMTIAAGERVALLGESGVGKSTLLNLIAGLDRPDAGEIRLGGQAIHAMDEDGAARLRAREIGFVFQAFHLLPHLKLWQNVAIPLLLIGTSQGEARERARAMLEQVGLGDRAASMPRELSGGEQQRVALARALVHAPRLILADEPTGNLDPRTGGRALALIDEQVRAHGAALLMVTHSQQAAAIAQRRLRLTPGGLETEA